jgi:hypothetical protein
MMVQASPRFSFQLVSLDAWANVVVWLVTEMSTTAGADADFGMRIGGKVGLPLSGLRLYSVSHSLTVLELSW